MVPVFFFFFILSPIAKSARANRSRSRGRCKKQSATTYLRLRNYFNARFPRELANRRRDRCFHARLRLANARVPKRILLSSGLMVIVLSPQYASFTRVSCLSRGCTRIFLSRFERGITVFSFLKLVLVN